MSQEGLFITIKIRSQAALLALVTTIGLTFLKLFVGILSGSVGMFSEGIHSFLDLISAAISFFTVRHAIKPADDDHPFGHGKFETLSSLFESLLLVIAAVLIVIEGYDHFMKPHPIQYQNLAILTILGSMGVSYWVYRNNLEASEKSESAALKVNALHFLSDVVASGGVLIGLVLIKLTGWLWIDPFVAFSVAAYIVFISAQQVKEAISELTESQLPENEIQEIKQVILNADQDMIEAHDLRTRKSGSTRHVDFHMVVCGQMSVKKSHEVCDKVENEINQKFPSASINIHVEPCEHAKPDCDKNCPILPKKNK